MWDWLFPPKVIPLTVSDESVAPLTVEVMDDPLPKRMATVVDLEDNIKRDFPEEEPV